MAEPQRDVPLSGPAASLPPTRPPPPKSLYSDATEEENGGLQESPGPANVRPFRVIHYRDVTVPVPFENMSFNLRVLFLVPDAVPNRNQKVGCVTSLIYCVFFLEYSYTSHSFYSQMLTRFAHRCHFRTTSRRVLRIGGAQRLNSPSRSNTRRRWHSSKCQCHLALHNLRHQHTWAQLRNGPRIHTITYRACRLNQLPPGRTRSRSQASRHRLCRRRLRFRTLRQWASRQRSRFRSRRCRCPAPKSSCKSATTRGGCSVGPATSVRVFALK